MNDAILVEEATDADVQSIAALIGELFEAMDSPPHGGPEHALDNCRAVMKDPSHHLLLARAGNSVVGFINFTTRTTIAHARPSGLIDELIVTEKCRGQGIGKQLIAAAAERCRELGCEELEVSTEKTNTRAREFYRECGFVEDAVLLERMLSD
jgi:ribosomal protein S18 acetylase RimI-like enzyme